MDYVRNLHTKNAKDSLIVPSNSTLEVFKEDSWSFSEKSISQEQRERGVISVYAAHCKANGFERLGYEWYCHERDLEEFGKGDLERWFAHVRAGFLSIIAERREDYLRYISKDLSKLVSKSDVSGNWK